MKNKKHVSPFRHLLNCLAYLCCLVITVITGFPFIMILLTSFKTQKAYFKSPWSFPTSFYLGNFLDVFRKNFPRYFLNSIFVTAMAVLLIVICSTMVSYAITKLKFRGATLVFGVIMIGMMIPIHTTLIPIYVMSKELGLYNTLPALIGPYVSFQLPVSTIIMCQFFREIPHEIEEAAIVDGCGDFGMYGRIILPLSKPAISTIVIYSLLHTWNEFTYAMTLIDTASKKTLPVGLKDFYGDNAVNIPAIMCAVLISSLPVIIAYFAAQEKVVGGLTSGAIKG